MSRSPDALDTLDVKQHQIIWPITYRRSSVFSTHTNPNYGSVVLLSHIHKVLALSKFALLKCEIEVNPVAQIPRATPPALRNFNLRGAGGPGNPRYGIHFIFAL